ncbi:MAG: outer membrane protein transport protein [Methylophilus sp.]|nr:outer membrane protein transport protein [Methylophilus sp.]
MHKSVFSILLLTSPLLANAAGFALIEQSASGVGNAFAGAAAVAEDASTIYFNPAGMTYIEGTQVVGAIHLINPNSEFNNQGSVKATFSGAAGGSGGDIGDLALLPNFYYKRDISEDIKFGLGISSPFGLKTEYDSNWIGRFQAIKSDLKTININPSIAFKVNDKLSLGAGISAMWIKAELTSAANLAPLGQPESTVKIKGDDWGFGINFGAIYQTSPDTRLGLTYRSPVQQHLEGNSTSPSTFLNGNPNATLNTNVTADITLPETFSISGFTHLNDTWDLLADITWTGWSQFSELRVKRDNGTNSTLTVTPEHWHDTMRYSLGANYKYSDTLKLRAGIAYDEEAIDDQYRTVRIPGNDRTWLAFGAGWQYSPATKLDLGYAHLFVKDASIRDIQNTVANGFKGNIIGQYDSSVDILSVQVTHNF